MEKIRIRKLLAEADRYLGGFMGSLSSYERVEELRGEIRGYLATTQREPGVWLSRREHEPEGGMILWRYPGGTRWRLSLAYKAKSGDYIDCGGAAGGNLADMTHFMEIPE